MFPIWENLGHEVLDNPKKADIQLCVIRIENKYNLPTVLRLDGIYYDLGSKYKRLNQNISKSVLNADGIIYQSKMSEKMCEKYLVSPKTELRKIIYNGIDDWNSFKTHDGFNIICCSKWRRPKRLKEITQLFLKFNNEHSDAKLWIIGETKEGMIGEPKIIHNNIKYFGMINFE
jgi:glycosyltransferase involved in cell wall biosynthesis